MTTPPQTRHVTLMVTHPGGDGHLTLDHHIPAQAADALLALVLAAPDTPDGGRHVTLHIAGPGRHPCDCVEVDDATADRVIAAMRAHMPERGYVELLAEARDHLRADADHGRACRLADQIDAALDHPRAPRNRQGDAVSDPIEVLAVPRELLIAASGRPITVSTPDGTEVVLRIPTAEEFREANRRGRELVRNLIGEAPPPVSDDLIAEIIKPLPIWGTD